MEINFEGLEKFLKEFKGLVERAERAEQGLIKLLGAENAKNLVEEMEHLKKRIDSNMSVTQDSIDLEKMTKEEIARVAYVFEPYVQNKLFNVGDKVEHLGKLYSCKKKHISSYETLPQLDGEHWEEVTGTGETVEKKKEREFYSGDKTYRLGDEVTHYNIAYKFISDIPASGKTPAENPKFWQKIEE